MLTHVWNVLQDSAAVLDDTGRIVAVNEAWRQFGQGSGLRTPDACLNANYLEICRRSPGPDQDLAQAAAAGLGNVLSGAAPGFELEYPCHGPDQERWFLLRATPFRENGRLHVLLIHQDITQRQRADQEREMSTELLRCINASTSARKLAHAATQMLQDRLDCEAVGIRLREGDDYPYVESRGFTPEFLAAENHLSQKDCARDGKPALACLCGGVIRGAGSAMGAHLAAHGAFWSNDVGQLLEEFPDLNARTRVGCVAAGYRSMALIPLRLGNDTLGLIQLNDRRAGRFTAEQIVFRDRMAGKLAIAFAQHQAQESLRQSERKYRVLAENIRDVVWRLDVQDMRFLYVSPSVRQQRGFTPEEVMAMPLDSSLMPGKAEHFKALIRRRVEDIVAGKESPDKAYTEEVEQPCKDGSTVWTEVVANLYVNHETGRLEVHGVSRDISERRRAETALKASEEHHRTLIHTAMEGFWLLDGQGHLLEVNEAYCRMSGYSQEELRAMRIEDLESAETPEDIDAHRQEILARGEDRFETRHRRKDGTIYDVEVSVQSRPSPNGQFVCFVHDISERKRAENALRASAEQHRTVLETATDGIYIAGPQGLLLEVNEAYCRMSGYTAQELLAMRTADLEANETPDQVTAHRQSIKTQGKGRFETRHRRKDGSTYDIEVSVQYPPAQGGNSICFLRDISERKRAEAEAARHQAAVAHLARLNTMGQMATGLAHELNQPLTAIRNYAHYCKAIVQSGAPTTIKLPEALDKVDQAAARAAAIIQRLRELVRKQEPARTPTDITRLLRKSLDLMGPALQRLQIRIAQRLGSKLPAVQVDPVQIEQVLVNLIQNAMDAMTQTPPAERVLIVSAHAGSTADSVHIAIADRGCGISPEDSARVFEEFFTTKPDGLGLGLAISKNIADAHGGSLVAYPNPEGGMTFELVLPARNGE